MVAGSNILMDITDPVNPIVSVNPTIMMNLGTDTTIINGSGYSISNSISANNMSFDETGLTYKTNLSVTSPSITLSALGSLYASNGTGKVIDAQNATIILSNAIVTPASTQRSTLDYSSLGTSNINVTNMSNSVLYTLHTSSGTTNQVISNNGLGGTAWVTIPPTVDTTNTPLYLNVNSVTNVIDSIDMTFWGDVIFSYDSPSTNFVVLNFVVYKRAGQSTFMLTNLNTAPLTLKKFSD